MSRYAELFERIERMIAPDEIENVECNLMDLPDAFALAEKKKRVSGILLAGFDAINEALRGFRPHEMTVICGPTGSGKTTFLSTIFLNFIAQGVPSFCAPVEVGYDSFVRKLASTASGISMFDIDERWPEIREKYYQKFFADPSHTLSIYESNISHMQLMADILHSHETRGTKIVLVDNLNFMTKVDSEKNEISVVNQVVQDWIRFIKKVPVHVLMVVHPRKTDGGIVESEFDIKGSSTIVQEAQNVLLFNRLGEKDEVHHPLVRDFCRDLKIAKCRENGRAWGTRILLSLDNKSEAYSERGLLG